MYSLLVLGIIPGTNIQISFQLWLECAAALGIVTLIIIFASKNRQTITDTIKLRTPLHAAQLHSRLS